MNKSLIIIIKGPGCLSPLRCNILDLSPGPVSQPEHRTMGNLKESGQTFILEAKISSFLEVLTRDTF